MKYVHIIDFDVPNINARIDRIISILCSSESIVLTNDSIDNSAIKANNRLRLQFITTLFIFESTVTITVLDKSK